MVTQEQAGTTGEVVEIGGETFVRVQADDYEWDYQMAGSPGETGFGYRGSDRGFVTLTGNNPECEWIANTMFRRWLNSECICGCSRSAYDDSEDAPSWDDLDEGGSRYLRPDCVQRFIERLEKAGAADEWGKWVTENRWSGLFGDAHYCLQEIYRALWKAEIRPYLQHKLQRMRSEMTGVEAELERLQRTLGDDQPAET